jgi:hypothetical protein
MKTKKAIAITIISLLVANVFGQENPKVSSTDKKETLTDYKYSFLTTLPSLTNWLGDDIEMYEIHFGYRITSNDKIGLKAVHWKLFQPLGIPLSDPKLMDKSEYYSGRLREIGLGIFYQRMIWKGLFATVEIMPMKKIFLNHENEKIDEGFRLYTSYHLGYHIPLFNGRAFIEPQIHCNYWPVDSNYPEGFKEKEEKWNNYFLFEPNLYIGINF